MKAGREGTILVGRGESPLHLELAMANRHGLVAGATGTGKTVTVQALAEGFSRAGVPVFVTDVKGDLAGLSQPAEPSPRLEGRARELGAEWRPQGFPLVPWDVFGEQGHPLRTTPTELGPLLLARLLSLNEVQTDVLHVVFRVADDEGLLLLDLEDLRAVLAHAAAQRREISVRYGAIHTASIAAIQRALLRLEQEGGELFLGEPALQLGDLLQRDAEGRGLVHVLAADRLVRSPRLYASALLWLLAELAEELPEVGDVERPRLVLFFDEAHLLFDDTPDALLDRIEQVARLIRSKGVGIWFATQDPLDVPPTVLGQLGNRVQHALRAFTPRDRRNVRAVAESFRPNPPLDPESAVTELGVGEALVSFLDAEGAPVPVERGRIRPPDSRMGTATEAERRTLRRESPLAGRYEQTLDRESAAERLRARAKQAAQDAQAAAAADSARPERAGRQRESALEAAAKSMGRSFASQLGRTLARSLLGVLSKR